MTNRAPRNRTVEIKANESEYLKGKLIKLTKPAKIDDIKNQIVNQDVFEILDYLPSKFIDILFIDPPYNLTKSFNGLSFKKMSIDQYAKWLDSWLLKMKRILKPTASIYICGDWRSSSAIHLVCEKYFIVRNRITFEREKGRGALRNWKNNSEDIWFSTMSDDYYFNSDAVKLKRRVIAPYRVDGKPKDWIEDDDGNFRLTYPSNIWTDITIPFWSMHENTPHPTQKPEKILAKIILASSCEGDTVFDPFAGVGTTGVVAKKLGRNFVMVEIDEEYCLYAQKRLDIAETDMTIQGYEGGVFWERNELNEIKKKKLKKKKIVKGLEFFNENNKKY